MKNTDLALLIDTTEPITARELIRDTAGWVETYQKHLKTLEVLAKVVRGQQCVHIINDDAYKAKGAFGKQTKISPDESLPTGIKVLIIKTRVYLTQVLPV